MRVEATATFLAAMLIWGIAAGDEPSGVKGLRLGMGMGEARELRLNSGGFNGSTFQCDKRGTLAICQAENQTIADLRAALLAQFVATSPIVQPKRIPIPKPYENTADELRSLSVAELVQLQHERDAQRRAAIQQQVQANNKADNVFRLAFAQLKINHDTYPILRDAVIAKWGTPQSTRTETLRTAMNAAVASHVDVWSSAAARLELLERCNTIDSSCLQFTSLSLQETLSKALATDAKDRADDL